MQSSEFSRRVGEAVVVLVDGRELIAADLLRDAVVQRVIDEPGDSLSTSLMDVMDELEMEIVIALCEACPSHASADIAVMATRFMSAHVRSEGDAMSTKVATTVLSKTGSWQRVRYVPPTSMRSDNDRN